jgi:hypothetical protein
MSLEQNLAAVERAREVTSGIFGRFSMRSRRLALGDVVTVVTRLAPDFTELCAGSLRPL